MCITINSYGFSMCYSSIPSTSGPAEAALREANCPRWFRTCSTSPFFAGDEWSWFNQRWLVVVVVVGEPENKNLKNLHWLVVSTQLKNSSQIGLLPQVKVKIKNIWVATIQFTSKRIFKKTAFRTTEFFSPETFLEEAWKLHPNGLIS